MPKLVPVKHRQLVKYLRQLGFIGPYGQGRKHSIMMKGDLTITIPNKHSSGVIDDIRLMRKILQQAGIEEETWENL